MRHADLTLLSSRSRVLERDQNLPEMRERTSNPEQEPRSDEAFGSTTNN